MSHDDEVTERNSRSVEDLVQRRGSHVRPKPETATPQEIS